MSSRKIKSQRKAELRKKNLGLGLGKIDVEEKKSNKITFDDDFVASDYDSDEHDEIPEKEVTPEDGDSSDDEIEEVSASAAKQQAMEMFASERKTRKEELAFSSKRKRKTKEVPQLVQPEAESEEEDFDEDFFAQVDEERKNESKVKKAKKSQETQKLGRHTTFVSEEDDPNAVGSFNNPVKADHNIEVVVLPSTTGNEEEGQNVDSNTRQKEVLSLAAGLGTAPSKTALSLCRGSLAVKEDLGEKGFEVKRSRRMNYSINRGKAASNFAFRSNNKQRR